MFSFFRILWKAVCVFSRWGHVERLCRMMRKKKSRETKSKSQNVWFDVCIPSIKRNAHFVDR